MLTSLPVLDSAFSNPTVLPSSEVASLEADEIFNQLFHLPIIETPVSLFGGPFVSVGDINWGLVYPKSNNLSCKKPKQATKSVMNGTIDSEEDLKRLIYNENRLKLSGYYYGSLSWVDASHILKRSKVGTFLVRDSEHCSYLFALSVQTKRGPTSCRIDYENGRFRLDSSEDLSDQMPRFDCVPDLIDHYVHLTKKIPRKSATKELSPVWLDMDEENSRDVPVQIYRPLYKNVRSLKHMCRVSLAKLQRETQPSMSPLRTSECDFLPTTLKNYLKEYPYSQ